jgi:hypothetical protein
VTKRSVVSLPRVAEWSTRERDGDVAVMARRGSEDVMVSFNEETVAWECSECGPLEGPRPNASVLTCLHVAAACRDLPYDVAVRIGTAVAKHRKTEPKLSTGAQEPSDADIAQARATIAENESKAKAERAREHDENFVKVTSVVTTRKATPEDLERLRAAREAKRRKSQGLTWA